MKFEYFVMRHKTSSAVMAEENILCETSEEAIRKAKERAIIYPEQYILIQVEARG